MWSLYFPHASGRSGFCRASAQRERVWVMATSGFWAEVLPNCASANPKKTLVEINFNSSRVSCWESNTGSCTTLELRVGPLMWAGWPILIAEHASEFGWPISPSICEFFIIYGPFDTWAGPIGSCNLTPHISIISAPSWVKILFALIMQFG